MAANMPSAPQILSGSPRKGERPARHYRTSKALGEPPALKASLIAVAFVFLGIFVLLPLWSVFSEAFSRGAGRVFEAITKPETAAAIRLTLLVAAVVVPFNVVFGIVSSWLVAKYQFPGKTLLLALIDLPFSVSPVISGMIFVLLFGGRSGMGQWLSAHNIPIIFAVPGIVLATTFVTFPFVAREVLPVMQSGGSDEEEAALTLGAGGWRIFFAITLPKIKWGVLYGIVLCSARTMGEFGAVSVVSGHIRGLTNTMPLQVEILYNEYDFVGAFAVASLLALVALATLGIKKSVEAFQRARA